MGKSKENIRRAIAFVDVPFLSFFVFLSSFLLSVFSRELWIAGAKLNSFLKNGAGFGDVGVEGFDDGGILLLDDAALQLKSEGEAAVVESKIFGEKGEALNGFVLREMNGQTLDLGVD
jgi:hypothetical protein